MCTQGTPCPQAGPLQRPFCLPRVRVPQMPSLPARHAVSGLHKALPGHTPPPQAAPRDPQVTRQPRRAVRSTPPSGCGLVPAPGAWAPRSSTPCVPGAGSWAPRMRHIFVVVVVGDWWLRTKIGTVVVPNLLRSHRCRGMVLAISHQKLGQATVIMVYSP